MRLIAVGVAVAVALAVAAPVAAQEPPAEEPPAPEPREVHPIVFPVAGPHHYTDTWGAPRGARRHEGTDIMADKMVPVVAAAAGTVGWMHDERGGNCCAMALEHDDGWASWYIHLNNDTPGTDDGQGWGFADGLAKGVHVEAGELIGWVGDSGNAEWTASHLHFELHRPDGVKINPYPSLQAAEEAGAPGDPAPAPDPGEPDPGEPDPEPSPGEPAAADAPWRCPDWASCDGVALVTGQARFELFSSIGAGAPDTEFLYGNPGDVPLLGDWDCDGVRTPAMYRPTNGFMYLRNANSEGIADVDYFYGDPADIPLAGDFDGDGCDTLAIYRADEGRVYVKNSLGTGVADLAYFFGNPGDKPFVGDFDGDGIDTVGLHRESTGFVYFRNEQAAGPADFEFFYGDPGDRILAGDWDGDGADSIAIYRPADASVYYRMSNSAGYADHTQPVGDYAAVLLATGSPGEPRPSEEEPPPDEPPPVLAAAGDIADCDGGAEATAALLDELFASGATGVVAPLGDLAYPDGTAEQFADCYDPAWGRHLDVTRPAPGNHEYHTPGAADYFEHFGDAAGDPAEGWYSYDLGTWHVVVLNSNCDEIGGCGDRSPQLEWLRSDLAASTAVCTVAYSHSPRYSSGPHGGDEAMASIWAELDAAGVELLLSGHDHIYERFAPRDAAGQPAAHGVRQFVVGTGGRSLYDVEASSPHSEAAYNESFGILVLTLDDGHYHWQFRPEAGFAYEDAGTGTCG